MESQAKYVCEKVERGALVNVEKVRQEIVKVVYTNGEINLYHDIIVNKAEKDDIPLWQMEQWAILSNVVNYIQYVRCSKKIL